MKSPLAVFLVPLLTLLACTISGCAESDFELASTSRLPKWVTLPTGATRNDVTVTLYYYAMPWGRTATFKVFDRRGRQLQKATGTLAGLEPLTLTPKVHGEPLPYPSYEVITVDGIIDIVDHRRMEPVFWMTDDPLVWAKFGARR